MIDHGLQDGWIEIVDEWSSFDRVAKELLIFCHGRMEGTRLAGMTIVD